MWWKPSLSFPMLGGLEPLRGKLLSPGPMVGKLALSLGFWPLMFGCLGVCVHACVCVHVRHACAYL